MLSRYLFYLPFSLIAISSYGQAKILVKTMKLDAHKWPVYRVSILNNSDSLLCVQHCFHYTITGKNADTLFLPTSDFRGNNSSYHLSYSVKDTAIDPERYPATIEFIRPRKKLEFIVRLLKTRGHGYLEFDYFMMRNDEEIISSNKGRSDIAKTARRQVFMFLLPD